MKSNLDRARGGRNRDGTLFRRSGRPLRRQVWLQVSAPPNNRRRRQGAGNLGGGRPPLKAADADDSFGQAPSWPPDSRRQRHWATFFSSARPDL